MEEKLLDYKAAIKSKGLKQNWIANQLGITGAMLSMYISGKTGMDVDKVNKLKKILA
jgi:predicted transcriptional regulator